MEQFSNNFDMPLAIPIEEAIYGRYGELVNSPALLMKELDLAGLLLNKKEDDAIEERISLQDSKTQE